MAVASSLATWRHVTSLPRAVLGRPHNDWTEHVGPFARDHLEQAAAALPRRHAAPLRDELARLDHRFEAATLHDPHSDPTRPWWARRGTC